MRWICAAIAKSSPSCEDASKAQKVYLDDWFIITKRTRTVGQCRVGCRKGPKGHWNKG